MHRGHSFTASNATPPAKYKMAASGPHGLIPWFCCISFWSEHSFYEKSGQRRNSGGGMGGNKIEKYQKLVPLTLLPVDHPNFERLKRWPLVPINPFSCKMLKYWIGSLKNLGQLLKWLIVGQDLQIYHLYLLKIVPTPKKS